MVARYERYPGFERHKTNSSSRVKRAERGAGAVVMMASRMSLRTLDVDHVAYQNFRPADACCLSLADATVDYDVGVDVMRLGKLVLLSIGLLTMCGGSFVCASHSRVRPNLSLKQERTGGLGNVAIGENHLR